MKYKRLLPYLGKYKKYAILSPLTIIVEVLLEICIPYLLSDIIDIGIANQDIPYILKIGGMMVGAALISLVFGGLAGKYAAIAATGLAKGIRKALFEKIQDFSFANVDHFSTPSLITRLTTDITYVQNSFMMIVRTLVRAPIMIVGATFMTVQINPELSLVFLLAIPILGVAIGTISTKAFPHFRSMFKKYDAMNASVQENLIAIRVVKSFVRRDYEDKKFIDSASDVMNASIRAEKVVICTGPIMMFAVDCCIICLLWFGGSKIIGGEMLTGELISFINYTTQILMNLMMISMVMITIVISQASITRILEVLDEKLDITDENCDPALQLADGTVIFDNVFFNYVNRDDTDDMTLSDINLQINSGELVGIIGGTGSAKSTLVQLIPRLYDVSRGTVSVGGQDVRKYKLQTLRDSVAIVLQKNVLFSGTIRENLKWGNSEASDDDIVEACKSAQAHDFIMAFPDGYDTELGQGGVNVSGGQKQRLCIARALLKKPKVMILDDSTSAVDTATESRIRQAFRTHYDKITTVVIAQRITSVMEADKIIVLEDGQINGVGKHDELMRTNEIYREVYESQQKGAEA